ncbi:hypothetical protein QMT40_000889 [Parvibaculaceae bacterium PLY_AMNH_Bact1]|nr:hypothetical protein QMT40_000889 [Parvibaculaceae bacterium PLY_AMNH_Bact1]
MLQAWFSSYYKAPVKRRFWQLALRTVELRALLWSWFFQGGRAHVSFNDVTNDILLMGIVRAAQTGMSREPFFHVTADLVDDNIVLCCKQIDDPSITQMDFIVPKDTHATSFWSQVEDNLRSKRTSRVILDIGELGIPNAPSDVIEMKLLSYAAISAPYDTTYALRILTSPAYGADERLLEKLLN